MEALRVGESTNHPYEAPARSRPGLEIKTCMRRYGEAIASARRCAGRIPCLKNAYREINGCTGV
jgi:hypothetical protein